MKNRVSPGK